MKTLSHAGVNFIEILRSDINDIDIVIDYFNAEVKDYPQHLELKGKNITVANAEHVGWYSYYDTVRIEVRKILDYVSCECDAVKGRLWKKYKEKHSRDLGTRDIEMYIKADPEFLAMQCKVREIEELYDKCGSIVESFKTRGYNLKNLTQLKIASYDDWII